MKEKKFSIVVYKILNEVLKIYYAKHSKCLSRYRFEQSGVSMRE